MKWYLFWEAVWHRLDKVSCWLWIHINIDYVRDRFPAFCYQRECNAREKRWIKYPEQSKLRIIDDMVARDHKMFREMMKQGED